MKPSLLPVQRVSVLMTLAFAASCSAVAQRSDDSSAAGRAASASRAFAPSSAKPNAKAPSALTLSMPAIPPELPDMSDRDRDGNRIDDALSGTNATLVDVEVMLVHPTTRDQLESFALFGGHLRHVFVAVSYGWSGSLPRANVTALASSLGPALHFIAAPRQVVPLLDEATRTGRVRPVWAPSFAGSAVGFLGNPNITIGVIDTGFDASHPDLSGNSAGFKDYSADAATVPRDVQGHGTHVAAIAVGSGAAFGLGPGTLRFTNSGDLTALASGAFLAGALHTPAYFGGGALLVSASARWNGGQGALLRALQAMDPDGAWSPFGSVTGASPEAIASANSNDSLARYSDALYQTDPASITTFAVANSVLNYPAVGDGFNAMSGVAPKCQWFGAKVFSDEGIGSSADTAAAVDDLVASRVETNTKLINISLTAIGGSDAGLRAKVNSAVDNGVLVVVAAGNGGPSSVVSDPGRAKEALTVGATNDQNELTTYTSAGSAMLSDPSSEDFKPDLLAPGGSSFRSLILAADSNSADADALTFPDLQADDYRGLEGTSMAAPFAAGAAALLIDALQQSGMAWDFESNSRALLVKMLLLASSTETTKNREVGSGGDPTLGRAQQPKDRYEGYGILNPDAAIEAVSTALPPMLTGTVNIGAPHRPEWERRAWGGHVTLHEGDVLTLALTMDQSADFDVYVYAGSPDPNGNPMLRASGASAIAGATDSLRFSAPAAETAYVIVKRVSGFGSFSLGSVHTLACGNGVLNVGEACDPAMPGSVACCDADCRALPDTRLCDDGNGCTTTDHCSAGQCIGSGPTECPVIECAVSGGCNPDTGQCQIVSVFDDGAACSYGRCSAGQCVADSATPKDSGAPSAADGAAGSVPAVATVGGSTSNPRTVSETQGGCGCFVAGTGQRAGSALSLAGLLGLLTLQRRRRRFPCQRTITP